MNLIILGVAIFAFLILIIEGGRLLIRSTEKWNPELKRIKKKLTLLSTESYEQSVDIIRKKRPLSDLPWLNQILERIPSARRLDVLLRQANVGYAVGPFLMLTAAMGSAGFTAALHLFRSFALSGLIALFSGALPFLYVKMKRRRRMSKFERQFPEALTLIARALKAGHAFSGGLQMVAQEFGDPIGAEFEKVLNEISYGIPLEEALTNLTERVDCPDLKFFAISIIIQKETGGNLAEILENIGYLIRERFKLHGRVRALSSEGRLSAVILTGLPFVFGAVLSVTNPEFLKVLSTDPIGKALVGMSLFLMLMGIIMMKKMVKIKV